MEDYTKSKKDNKRNSNKSGKGKTREFEDKGNGKITSWRDAKPDMIPRDNEVSWYKGSANHTKLVDGAANGINFEIVGGLPLRASNIVTDFVPPAIMTLRMVTGPGICSPGNTNAANLAASYMWATVRSKLTNASRYQAADLIMAYCAMDEVYAFANHVRRMFTCANMYSPANRQWPKTLVCALYDFAEKDFQDLIDHKADYMQRYNNLVLSMVPLTIPENFGFVDRHRFLYNSVFSDGHSQKSQLYGFKPYGYRIWDDLGSDQGTALRFYPLYSAESEAPKAELLLNDLQNMITALTGSESYLEILGDIWKTWGTKTAYQGQLVNEFDLMEVNYNSYNVLSQIENSLNVPVAYKDVVTGMYDITQNAARSQILFQPRFGDKTDKDVNVIQQANIMLSDPSEGVYPRALLNAHSESVLGDDVIEMTRMLPTWTVDDSGQRLYALESMGYDFIDSFEIWGFNTAVPEARDAHELYAYNVMSLTTTTGATIDPKQVKRLALLMNFDWAPRMYVCPNQMGSPDDPSKYFPISDLDNYSYVDAEQMRILNDNIQMATWKVGDM